MKKEKKLTKAKIKKLERIVNRKKLKEWSIKVRERYNNKCAICGTDKYIHAHHLIPKEIKELRYEIDNGVALCARHHKYDIECSAHKNPIAFLVDFKAYHLDEYKKMEIIFTNYYYHKRNLNAT